MAGLNTLARSPGEGGNSLPEQPLGALRKQWAPWGEVAMPALDWQIVEERTKRLSDTGLERKCEANHMA